MLKRLNTRGFTAFELTVVFSLIFIICIVALTRYSGMAHKINYGLMKRNLVHIQAAIEIYRMNSFTRGNDSYPTLDLVQDNEDDNGSMIFSISDKNLPINPFSRGIDPDGVIITNEVPVPQDDQGAWAYDPKTGKLYNNTISGLEKTS